MSNLDISLLPWQEEVWADSTRFKVIAAGRRCGKSRYAAYRLVVEALSGTKGETWYVAPTQAQARDIMWKTILEIAGDLVEKYHVNNLQITLVNGSSISLKGGDRPDTMRGSSLRFLVMDEIAQIKEDVWSEILRPALADLKGQAVFIGTPEGRNHFYDMYCYAEAGEDPDWRAWHFTSYDNPILDPKEIDAAKRSMSTYAFKKEFEASFSAQGSEVFKETWIKFDDEEPKNGDYYIAIDLAGFETMGKKKKNSRLDDTAISVVKVTDQGHWWVKDIINGRWDLKETAEVIFKAVKKYKPVAVGIERGIAQQAVLSPLGDLMRRENRFFNVQTLTHGNQKKSDRIIWALQGRMEHERVTIAEGDWNAKFLDQLFQFPSHLTKDDLIDSLSYIDQLATVPYWDLEDLDDEYESLDLTSGY